MSQPRALILACGALAAELNAVLDGGAVGAEARAQLTVECLPGKLHNHPERIPSAVDERLDAVQHLYDLVVLGYADCGTGGRLDEICRRRGVARLPGPHCYASYAGQARFAAIQENELGTLYLTDYLAKHFDLLVWRSLGLDRHPELLELYFGHYERVVHLAQLDDPAIRARAAAAADRLGLAFESHHTGYGEIGEVVVALGDRLERSAA